MHNNCRDPTLEEWEDDSLTPKMGTWESIGTPKTSEFDYNVQNTLHCSVLYIIGKLSKCRCRKWAHMSHLDICSTSYDEKKGQESNWQFDSQPPKVGNRPDPSVCRWSATHHWKAFDKGYTFSPNLIVIGGLHRKLCAPKVAGVPLLEFRDCHLGVPGQKASWMWPLWRAAEYTIWGKVVASPEFGPWWVLWV
jgi:hypothetical protein